MYLYSNVDIFLTPIVVEQAYTAQFVFPKLLKNDERKELMLLGQKVSMKTMMILPFNNT